MSASSSRPSPSWRRPVGLGLIALGGVVIALAAAYYTYSAVARSDLPGLVARSRPVVEEPRDLVLAQPPGRYTPAYDSPRAPGSSGDDPGAGLRWADWARLPTTTGQTPRSTWVRIPAINLDAPIVEVGLVLDDGKQAWQRPVDSVGHHQGTANPGEGGNTVLSGHLNSPVRGEGSVFRNLPRVASLLREGRPVEVVLFTATGRYVYQVVATDVVSPDDLNVFVGTERPTLTLVTCVPDRVYSHRLVVTALLVKEGDGGVPAVAQTGEGATVAVRR